MTERGIGKHLHAVRSDEHDGMLATDGKRGYDEALPSAQVSTRQQFLWFACRLLHECHLLLMRKSVECEARHFCLII